MVTKREAHCFEHATLQQASAENLQKIGEAFGEDGLGFLVVRNVPGYTQARERLLNLIRQFALLPEEVRARYEKPELHFQFGWSHGKEVLVNGKVDEAKGSYYLNPFDANCENDESSLSAKFNVWPNDVVPGFEAAAKDMSRIMKETALQLARLCDQYVASRGLKSASRLEDVIGASRSAKGRLLYYFPQTSLKQENSWCGIHCDHGSITCLTKALYFDEKTGEEVTSKVSDGLEITASDGSVVSVQIPADCIAFQIGQAAQIHSGSVLRATPHAVSFPKVLNVSRCTYALFLQPDASMTLDVPAEAQAPKLPVQFDRGMDFGQFTEATVAMTHRSKL